MNEEDLLAFLISEANKPFSGWDFSYLNNRMVDAPLDWSYPSMVLQQLHSRPVPRSLLDMGTGGGEFFSSLHPFPPFTCATEAYPPNVPIARERLEPLGVQVFAIDEEDPVLPFASEQFDLILNRHEFFRAEEVARILAPGGVFITQQVGSRNGVELIERMGVVNQESTADWSLHAAVDYLVAAGLNIERAEECFSTTRIFDTGAVAYYFKAIPWEIPDFSVEKYFEALFTMQREIEEKGFLDTTQHRCLIFARKSVL